MRFAQLLFTLALFSAAALAQLPLSTPASDSKVEDVFLARDDGAGKAGDSAEVFSPGDIPIHCVIMLTSTEPTPVRMLLVAVKVPGVKEGTNVVSAAYTTKQGEDRVYFRGRPDGKWVAGTYRIDVFVADKLERSVAFEVKGTSVPAAATKFAPSKTRKRVN